MNSEFVNEYIATLENLKVQHREQFERFIALAYDLHPQIASLPSDHCAGLSPHMIAAHMIRWEAEAARCLHAYADGEDIDLDYDIASINARSELLFKAVEWLAVLETLEECHRRLQDAPLSAHPGCEAWLLDRIADLHEHASQLEQLLH